MSAQLDKKRVVTQRFVPPVRFVAHMLCVYSLMSACVTAWGFLTLPCAPHWTLNTEQEISAGNKAIKSDLDLTDLTYSHVVVVFFSRLNRVHLFGASAFLHNDVSSLLCCWTVKVGITGVGASLSPARSRWVPLSFLGQGLSLCVNLCCSRLSPLSSSSLRGFAVMPVWRW